VLKHARVSSSSSIETSQLRHKRDFIINNPTAWAQPDARVIIKTATDYFIQKNSAAIGQSQPTCSLFRQVLAGLFAIKKRVTDCCRILYS